MPAAEVIKQKHFLLLSGDDEFAMKARAREVFQSWTSDPNIDREIIDGSVSNAGEALKAISKFLEALQTFPFFGGWKVVWLQNCNFLTDDRTSSSQAVTEALSNLADVIKRTPFHDVRVLVTAPKVDKRKTFYKSFEKAGEVAFFSGWSIEDKDWAAQAEQSARGKAAELKKTIADVAVSELVLRVGPNPRLLHLEVEKLCLYCGARSEITAQDVILMTGRNKNARAFALGEALGERDPKKVLTCLENEFWEIKSGQNKEKSDIGVLYGLISKIRVLLLLGEAIRLGWLRPTENYAQFKAQLSRLSPDQFPKDKKFNLTLQHPYVLFQAAGQVRNYSQLELIQAMEILQKANMAMISSNAESMMVLQSALLSIVGTGRVPK
jgi:DNA polymerase III subunit delta